MAPSKHVLPDQPVMLPRKSQSDQSLRLRALSAFVQRHLRIPVASGTQKQGAMWSVGRLYRSSTPALLARLSEQSTQHQRSLPLRAIVTLRSVCIAKGTAGESISNVQGTRSICLLRHLQLSHPFHSVLAACVDLEVTCYQCVLTRDLCIHSESDVCQRPRFHHPEASLLEV